MSGKLCGEIKYDGRRTLYCYLPHHGSEKEHKYEPEVPLVCVHQFPIVEGWSENCLQCANLATVAWRKPGSRLVEQVNRNPGPSFTRENVWIEPAEVVVKEMVDHPIHYGGKDNPYEHVKVMEAVLQDSPLNPYMGGLFYNCTKYLWRLGRKSVSGSSTDIIGSINKQTIEDAKKAKWYLDRLVQHLEGEKQ